MVEEERRKTIRGLRTIVDAIELLVNSGLLFHLVTRTKDEITGATKYQINKTALADFAPHYAKDRTDEAQWARIVSQLDSGEQTTILLHFMDRLEEVQQADMIISACEMSYGRDDAERKVNTDETVKELKRIAAITHPNPDIQQALRVKEADSLNFIKGDPNEYWIIKLQNLTGKTFAKRNFKTPYKWITERLPRLARVFSRRTFPRRIYRPTDRAARNASVTVVVATAVINNRGNAIVNRVANSRRGRIARWLFR